METIRYWRSPDLPGVELRTVRDSERCFRLYSTGFEFLAPSTWRGQVWHRRRREIVAPGWVLSAHPGDVFVGERVLEAGSWTSLTIDADMLASYVADPAGWRRLQLRPFAKLSERLATPLFRVIQAMVRQTGAADARANLTVFLQRASRDLQDRDDEMAPPDGADPIDEVGLSRFQALRAFKRRFGLAPRTYDLRVRLGLAQKSLRAGAPPAHVAAELGFVDQSHLTRHFKRFVGITPAAYARSSGG